MSKKQRIAQLEEEVAKLKKRVRELEDAIHSPPNNVIPPMTLPHPWSHEPFLPTQIHEIRSPQIGGLQAWN